MIKVKPEEVDDMPLQDIGDLIGLDTYDRMNA
jgi:hypothetical protein